MVSSQPNNQTLTDFETFEAAFQNSARKMIWDFYWIPEKCLLCKFSSYFLKKKKTDFKDKKFTFGKCSRRFVVALQPLIITPLKITLSVYLLGSCRGTLFLVVQNNPKYKNVLPH